MKRYINAASNTVLTWDALSDAVDLFLYDEIIKPNPNLHIKEFLWSKNNVENLDRILNPNSRGKVQLDFRDVQVEFEPDGQKHLNYFNELNSLEIDVQSAAKKESEPQKIKEYLSLHMKPVWYVEQLELLYTSYKGSVQIKESDKESVIDYLVNRINNILNTVNSKLRKINTSWKLYYGKDLINYISLEYNKDSFSIYLYPYMPNSRIFKNGFNARDLYLDIASKNTGFRTSLPLYTYGGYDIYDIEILITYLYNGFTAGLVSTMDGYEQLLNKVTDEFIKTYTTDAYKTYQWKIKTWGKDVYDEIDEEDYDIAQSDFSEEVESILKQKYPGCTVDEDTSTQSGVGEDLWSVTMLDGTTYSIGYDYETLQETIKTDGAASAAKEYTNDIIEQIESGTA